MINLKGIMGIPLLKKSRFTGSDSGLRYMLEKRSSEEEGDRLAAVYWWGEFCWEVTPEEEKTTEYFSFSEEGLLKAQEWLNQQLEHKGQS